MLKIIILVTATVSSKLLTLEFLPCNIVILYMQSPGILYHQSVARKSNKAACHFSTIFDGLVTKCLWKQLLHLLNEIIKERFHFASVSKRVLLQNLPYENESYSHVHCKSWFCTRRHFETEAKGNL